MANPLFKKIFTAESLFRDYPALPSNKNKKIVYDLAYTNRPTPANEIAVSRWPPAKLPNVVVPSASTLKTKWILRQDVFDYEPIPLTDETRPKVEWHVNFADRFLFCAYGGGLFAQDEMQVAEHPIFGSIREALLELSRTNPNAQPLTSITNGETPILITGAERRVKVHVDRNAALHRPNGLYGNRFAAASAQAIQAATEQINPPSITNLIAMAAPQPNYGKYLPLEIYSILSTAYTSFRAARIESAEVSKVDSVDKVVTVVHTGNWGTGAFGGNRVLMALLQLLAATLAEIDVLVFHSFDDDGSNSFRRAEQILTKTLLTKPNKDLSTVIEQIDQQGFQWGVSDGN